MSVFYPQKHKIEMKCYIYSGEDMSFKERKVPKEEENQTISAILLHSTR